ncbi:putative phospholipase B-like 2 [Echinococcus granulosus]|uniref:Phospholipase B-like n=1 Tax=Echinococcus granulosus TaxID=6210 RepID=A0A068WQS4_ECHGR|nr:putative phospholipase B-like 2 [Echinococcus granulosus]CDS20015.1 LAMA protein 2 [Echinococcus granulosus]
MGALVLLFCLLVTIGTSTAISPSERTMCVVASEASDGTYDFSLESETFHMRTPGYDFLIPAASWFNQSVDDVGMAFQTVKTSGEFEDKIQAYWAGFLELYISRDVTYAQLENTFGGFCKDNSSACQELEEYLRRNLEMTIKRSLQSGDIDPYWHQMELVLWQMRGIQDAWNNITINNSKFLTTDYLMHLLDDVFDIHLLQLAVDMGDVSAALGLYEALEEGPNGKHYFTSRPSCSALVKLAPDHKDIFISHDTWRDYEGMLKVVKYYEFAWRLTRDPSSPVIPADKILFSSYPSTINSIDDFYVTSTGLVIQETTNGNENPNLWPFVRHGLNSTVLGAFRVMIATRLARTPSEWIGFFARENSGTYNNQWMVIDTKLFDPSKPLPEKDLFWVAEQIPGLVQSADVTEHLLNKSYWGSYNNPYFKFIHEISGFDDLEKKFGECFSYEMTPRAQIFRRNHSTAVSLPSVYRLMRFNDFTHDPLSHCNCTPPYTAQYAISARSDLNDPNGVYPFPLLGYRLHGATDVKLVNLELARSLSMIAVAGPTYDQVPVFDWSRLRPERPRPLMHPERWAFPLVVIQVENNHNQWMQPYLRTWTMAP